MSDSPQAPTVGAQSLSLLLELGRRVRTATSVRELQFLAVNESHALAPYRQAALWLRDGGVVALSGVVQVEANVPYVLWLGEVFAQLAAHHDSAVAVDGRDFPAEIAAQWADWLPTHALWLPVRAVNPSADNPQAHGEVVGGLLLARDEPWGESPLVLLTEWLDIWGNEWRHRHRPPMLSWQRIKAGIQSHFAVPAGKRWWQSRAALWGVGVLVVLCVPVRLTVLAPGELVPANPEVIRAPLDGVIDAFHVQPNQKVAKGQVLFGFDEALIQSKLDVSQQALSTAEAEYRQAAQQALSDEKSKAQLAQLAGKIEEKRAEAAFVAEQLNRARVLAPRDGIALFDDPSEWIGKPVGVGERIMRITAPADAEVEAWVPLADAIPLPDNASVTLYLNASPLSPVEGAVRYLAFNAVERPDGSYAYRLRARLVAGTDHRVGLKGTARIQGPWVPLVYWVLRRPVAGIRAYLGW